MPASLKLFISVFFFLPLVQAQSPAPTQAMVSSAPTASPVNAMPAESPVPSPAPVAKTPPIETSLSFEEVFNLGTRSYQDKKYDVALQAFQRALDLHPDSSSVLNNLGLTAFQLHQKGLSIGYFRRALMEDPANLTADAGLRYVWSQLDVKEIPHQLETYERFRESFLNLFSLNALHLLTALLFFSSGWIWLRYAGQRRRALEQEIALPQVPVIGGILTVLLVIAVVSTVVKSYDLTVPRATIIVDKVSVQTAPGDGQNGLFDLYAGFEVILRHFSQDWVQVSYPGGMTGWVKKDSLMATSSKSGF